jgi:transcriptional regulator with XRE-family HTH domain
MYQICFAPYDNQEYKSIALICMPIYKPIDLVYQEAFYLGVISLDIGKNIQQARRSKSLTQEELAKRLGMTYQYISAWERGLKTPSATNIARLAKALNVNSNVLLEGSVDGTLQNIKPDTTQTKKPTSIPLYSRKRKTDTFEDSVAEKVERIYVQAYKPMLSGGLWSKPNAQTEITVKGLIRINLELENHIKDLEDRVKQLEDKLD